MSHAPHLVAPESDLSPLARIHAASFDDAWSEPALRDMLKVPGTSAFSTSDGFIMVRAAADEAEVLTLAVAPDARGRGLGVALVSVASAHAYHSGARALFLEVKASNAPARALYKRFGFREAGRRRTYYGGKEDALILRVDLPIIPLGNPKASITVTVKPRGNDRDAD
jgi:[ribosomal protein S18]-alanine N-acetyltransferase